MDEAPTVEELLAAAGLAPPAEELELFKLLYPILRARADTVYTVDLGLQP